MDNTPLTSEDYDVPYDAEEDVDPATSYEDSDDFGDTDSKFSLRLQENEDLDRFREDKHWEWSLKCLRLSCKTIKQFTDVHFVDAVARVAPFRKIRKALRRGYPFTANTVEIVAFRGKLRSVEVLHDCGAPWGKAANGAAFCGDYYCLEQILFLQAPADSETVLIAARRRNVHCLQSLIKYKVPFDLQQVLLVIGAPSLEEYFDYISKNCRHRLSAGSNDSAALRKQVPKSIM
jgi:hypothetical protein